MVFLRLVSWVSHFLTQFPYVWETLILLFLFLWIPCILDHTQTSPEAQTNLPVLSLRWETFDAPKRFQCLYIPALTLYPSSTGFLEAPCPALNFHPPPCCLSQTFSLSSPSPPSLMLPAPGQNIGTRRVTLFHGTLVVLHPFIFLFLFVSFYTRI